MNAFEVPAHTDREALTNFVEGLKIAESAAKQLAYYNNQPAWLQIRLLLEGVRDNALALSRRGPLWTP